jgi:IPT/TIG domain
MRTPQAMALDEAVGALTIPVDGWLDFDWGDGTAITSVRPPVYTAQHTYATNGTKTITVRATRADHTTETGRGTATFVVLPATLTGLAPTGGPAAGGTAVGISGQRLTGTTLVFFASNQATNVAVVSDTSVTCTSPPGIPDALVNVNAMVRGVASDAVQYQYQSAEEEEAGEAPEEAPTRTRTTTRGPRGRRG